jgi:hypothetical protein
MSIAKKLANLGYEGIVAPIIALAPVSYKVFHKFEKEKDHESIEKSSIPRHVEVSSVEELLVGTVIPFTVLPPEAGWWIAVPAGLDGIIRYANSKNGYGNSNHSYLGSGIVNFVKGMYEVTKDSWRKQK